MEIITIIRILLEICLICIIWFNAHWSVALILTLIIIGNEIKELT